MKKENKDMSTDEILRQQLELLAERSKSCTNEELTELTTAMVEICKLFYLP